MISFVVYNLLTWMQKPQFIVFSVYWATMAMTVFVNLNPTAYSIGGRLEGTLGNSNLYGFALLISAMFAINQIFESRIVFKIFYLVTVPFLLHMIIETGSRKAMLSVAIFIIVYTAFKFKYEIYRRPIIAIMSVIMLLSAGIYMTSYMEHTKQYKRLAKFFETVETRDINKADESTYYRYVFYKRGLKIAAEHPAFGVGLDNFRNETYGLTNTRTGTYAHSNYVELLADTGILGFIIYCSMYLTIMVRIARLKIKYLTDSQKGLYLLAVSSIIIYILYDFAMVSYFEKFSWLILTFIITATLLLKDNVASRINDTIKENNILVSA
jgi:O-antigen ligase